MSATTAPAATTPPQKSATRQLTEDLIVTGFGLASSTGVAYGCWACDHYWDTAIYSWMLNFVFPVGAFLCGLVAAIGYWVGARVFNHKPSRWLLLNIVLVSLTTFFAIHHLHYTRDMAGGVPIARRMSFTEYLVAVTENMVYKTSGGRSDDQGTELGKWGWGVAGLQVLGFSFGGFAVYAMLASVPFCNACGKYLSEKQSRSRKSKTPDAMLQSFQRAAALFDAGQLQAAIDDQASHGEPRVLRVKAFTAVKLRKCPNCSYRRLQLTFSERKGNNFAVTASREIFTHEDLSIPK